MHASVQQLLSLQQIDARVAKVQAKIDAIPKESAQRRSSVDRIERGWKELDEAITSSELRYRELELKVQGLDHAIKKQEEHRDKAQNASTFEAAQHQISYLAEDRDKVQTEQLKLMEIIEERSPQRDEAKGRLEAAEAEFAEYEAEAKKLHDELVAKRDGIAVERESFLEGVGPQELALYRELFESRDGQAVVTVEGGFCSGCYTRITPNDIARLQGGSSVVTCKSCGRILYAS